MGYFYSLFVSSRIKEAWEYNVWRLLALVGPTVPFSLIERFKKLKIPETLIIVTSIGEEDKIENKLKAISIQSTFSSNNLLICLD